MSSDHRWTSIMKVFFSDGCYSFPHCRQREVFNESDPGVDSGYSDAKPSFCLSTSTASLRRADRLCYCLSVVAMPAATTVDDLASCSLTRCLRSSYSATAC